MTASTRFRLSKSKIAAFEHCPRRLWLQIHRRDVGKHDPDTLSRFAFGHSVGKWATLLMPDGVMIETGVDTQAALAETTRLLRLQPARPIFEATFQYRDVLVRADILEPDGDGAWRAIEVKASTTVRRYQLADIATQVWVMRGCGLQISHAVIRHLAPPFSWRHPDIGAPRFIDADVTRGIERHLKSRAAVAQAARDAIRGDEVRRQTGSHCERPFNCEFRAYCKLGEMMPLLNRGHLPALEK